MMGLPLVLLVALSGAVLAGTAALGLRELRSNSALRGIALAVDIVLFAAALGVTNEIAPEGGSTIAWLLVGSLASGAVLHALGILAWNGEAAWLSRFFGLILVTMPLLVPSTLTLMLPLVGLLVPTLLQGTSPQTPRPAA